MCYTFLSSTPNKSAKFLFSNEKNWNIEQSGKNTMWLIIKVSRDVVAIGLKFSMNVLVEM